MTPSPDWTAIGAVGTIIGALAAIGAALYAVDQLKNLNESLRVNSLMALVQFESEMNARAEKLDEFLLEIIRATEDSETSAAVLTAMENRRIALFENYANACDRLAFCILKNYIPESQISAKDWRREYKKFFDKFVSDNSALIARPDTSYDNIRALHQKWQRPEPVESEDC